MEAHSGIAVNRPLAVSLNVQAHDGRDHGDAEPDDAVNPEMASEGGRTSREEEDHEDIDSHGEGPPRI